MKQRLILGANVFAVIVAAVFVVSAVFGLAKLNSLERKIGSGPLANGVWAISQGETRYLHFLNALQAFIHNPGPERRDNALLQLDLLWNRYTVMTSGEVGAMVAEFRGSDALMDRLRTALEAADRLSDPLTPENAAKIIEHLEPLESPLRALAVDGATTTHQRWDGMIAESAAFTAVITWGGVVALFSGLIVIALLYRENRRVGREAARREEIERALKIALADAMRADRAKSEFLAAMSHELRTPLNAILGFSEIIERAALGPVGSPKYSEYAADIHSSGSHLLEIINDILDLSKIEAGQMELRPSTFDLRDALTDCSRLISAKGTGDSGRISVDVSDDVQSLHADLRMFRQIVINVLSNADKYTPNGGTISVVARGGNGGETTIEVTDTGTGIHADDLKRVMEPFAQARRDAMLSHEGTGLGLSLAKRLVEVHGGTLAIESEVGVGTTVRLMFPSIADGISDRRAEAAEISG